MPGLTILPTAGQSLNVTRDPIRNNFQYIQNSFGGTTDHVDFNTPPNNGKHKSVTFPVVAADTGTPPEIALYNKLLAAQPTLYLRKSMNSGALNNIIPASATNLDLVAPVPGTVITFPGFTFLPSGIFLSWGTATCGTVGGSRPVTIAQPAPNSLLYVIIGSANLSGAYPGLPGQVAYERISAANPTDTFLVSAYNLGGFSYLAIGY